jgi:hypothetical protein
MTGRIAPGWRRVSRRERPRHERPRHERPRHERPRHERPRHERPRRGRHRASRQPPPLRADPQSTPPGVARRQVRRKVRRKAGREVRRMERRMEWQTRARLNVRPWVWRRVRGRVHGWRCSRPCHYSVSRTRPIVVPKRPELAAKARGGWRRGSHADLSPRASIRWCGPVVERRRPAREYGRACPKEAELASCPPLPSTRTSSPLSTRTWADRTRLAARRGRHESC